jgi:cytochrome c-type biogenesis protein
MKLDYVLAFLEGAATFVSPCILPLLPIYLAYFASTRQRKLMNIIGFILGFTLVFVVLGATATSLGHILKINAMLLKKISGAILVLFGLNFIGLIKIQYFERILRFNFNPENLNAARSILFGIVFAFSWSPCAGPLLGAALVLASVQETLLEGILLLFTYSMGLAIPFIVSALIMEKIKIVSRWFCKYQFYINLISGIILIITGSLVFFDKLKYFNTIFF